MTLTGATHREYLPIQILALELCVAFSLEVLSGVSLGLGSEAISITNLLNSPQCTSETLFRPAVECLGLSSVLLSHRECAFAYRKLSCWRAGLRERFSDVPESFRYQANRLS